MEQPIWLPPALPTSTAKRVSPVLGIRRPRRQQIPHQQTMSSREIAELTGKCHGNVKRTIDTLSAKGVIPFPHAEEKATAGRPPLGL